MYRKGMNFVFIMRQPKVRIKTFLYHREVFSMKPCVSTFHSIYVHKNISSSKVIHSQIQQFIFFSFRDNLNGKDVWHPFSPTQRRRTFTLVGGSSPVSFSSLQTTLWMSRGCRMILTFSNRFTGFVMSSKSVKRKQ